MKTEIVEQDGLWIIKCKSTGEEMNVYPSHEEALADQSDAELYCD